MAKKDGPLREELIRAANENPGLRAHVVPLLRRADLTDEDEAAYGKWTDEGFTPKEAKKWEDAGFEDAREASPWRDVLNDPKKAFAWHDLRTDPHDYEAWADDKALLEAAFEISEDLGGDILGTLQDSRDHVDAYEFQAGGRSYVLFEDDSDAKDAAVDRLKADLEDDPDQAGDWVADYLEMGPTNVRVVARDIVTNEMAGMTDRDFCRQDGTLSDWEDAETEEEKDKISSAAREAFEEKRIEEVEEELEDPVRYLVREQGLHTIESLMKSGLVTIDYERAAQARIDDNGWEDVLSRYDGRSNETAKGWVWFRKT